VRPGLNPGAILHATLARLAVVAVALSVAVLPASPAVAPLPADVVAIPQALAVRAPQPRADRFLQRRVQSAPRIAEVVTAAAQAAPQPVAPPVVKAVKPAKAKPPAAKTPKRTEGAVVVAAGGEASGRAAVVISVALQQVGKPYVWGAAGPGSFDCSGLILYAMARVGIRLPHNADAIGGMGRSVPRSQWLPGTVISYGGHVALYLGSGRMVEAAHAGVPVRVTTVRPGNGRWLF
jgi:cell wall-associated NlpC family hydrolase